MFNRKRWRIIDVLHKAMSLVGEFAAEQKETKPSNLGVPRTSKWQPPAQGTYKVNADVATFTDGSMGIGAIVRDYKGEVILSTCTKIHGVDKVEIGEALATRHALKIAYEAGLRAVTVESDNLKLIKHLQRKTKELIEFGYIVNDILELAKYCNSCSFTRVKKDANRVAHHLARRCSLWPDFSVWMEEVPDGIMEHVMRDIALMNE